MKDSMGQVSRGLEVTFLWKILRGRKLSTAWNGQRVKRRSTFAKR